MVSISTVQYHHCIEQLEATSASAAVAVAPPSVLKGKTIEEIVNKWSSELENQVREFNKFAAEVAVWDRALMENGNNVRPLIPLF